MTTAQEQSLATVIEATVRAIPGVSNLFRAGPLASQAIGATARLIGIREDEPRIRVEYAQNGLRADIAIGVRNAAGAVETLRHVDAAVRAVIAEQNPVPADIRVTVVHVEETTQQKGLQK